jgi:hypothetical protein
MSINDGYVVFSEGMYQHLGRVLFADLYFGWLAQFTNEEEHF